MPSVGVYCSTKYAVEAINDALRLELKPWGIHVIIVEPGRFKTEFQEKAYVDLEIEGIGEVTEEVKNHYIKMTRKLNEESVKKIDLQWRIVYKLLKILYLILNHLLVTKQVRIFSWVFRLFP